MQRIDENTCIDDTLVTCAEYQLFIDEMREQGKYYQPDHWTSYQFPKGQAREPILGVRHSDAIAFCEWLTKRGDGQWHYRLPTTRDANGFSLSNNLNQMCVGYWIIVAENQAQFTWISLVEKDPRRVTSALDRIRTLAFTRKRSDLDINLVRALDLNFDWEMAQSLILTYRHELGDTLKRLDFDLSEILNREDDYENNRPHDIDRFIHGTQELALDAARFGSFALDLYVDILTLQERIAGRSPAFEGIRLVKERTR